MSSAVTAAAVPSSSSHSAHVLHRQQGCVFGFWVGSGTVSGVVVIVGGSGGCSGDDRKQANVHRIGYFWFISCSCFVTEGHRERHTQSHNVRFVWVDPPRYGCCLLSMLLWLYCYNHLTIIIRFVF